MINTTTSWNENFCLSRLRKMKPDQMTYTKNYGAIKYEEEWLEWVMVCGQRLWSMGKCGGNYPAYFQDKTFDEVSHQLLLFFTKIDPQLRRELLTNHSNQN